MEFILELLIGHVAGHYLSIFCVVFNFIICKAIYIYIYRLHIGAITGLEWMGLGWYPGGVKCRAPNNDGIFLVSFS